MRSYNLSVSVIVTLKSLACKFSAYSVGVDDGWAVVFTGEDLDYTACTASMGVLMLQHSALYQV